MSPHARTPRKRWQIRNRAALPTLCRQGSVECIPQDVYRLAEGAEPGVPDCARNGEAHRESLPKTVTGPKPQAWRVTETGNARHGPKLNARG